MSDNARKLMKHVIEEKIKRSFVEEYQSKVSDSEALGIAIAHYFQWSGIEILETLFYALEDANYHTLNMQVEKWIKMLKMGSERSVKL